MDLIDRTDHWGTLTPDRPALISGLRRLTYGELLRASDALAAYLVRALPRDHSPIAGVGHKQPEMLIAFLGAIKSGHPYIPVEASTPPQEVNRILEAAQAGLVLEPAQVAALTAGPQPVGVPAASWRPGPDDPWVMLFDSDSATVPSGAALTGNRLSCLLDGMLSVLPPAESGETFFNQAPFSFNLSTQSMSLATGGTLFGLDRNEVDHPRKLFKALGRSGASVWVSIPALMERCLAEAGFSAGMLPRLRRFLFCGETLAPEAAAGLLERFPAAEVWHLNGLAGNAGSATPVRLL